MELRRGKREGSLEAGVVPPKEEGSALVCFPAEERGGRPAERRRTGARSKIAEPIPKTLITAHHRSAPLERCTTVCRTPQSLKGLATVARAPCSVVLAKAHGTP